MSSKCPRAETAPCHAVISAAWTPCTGPLASEPEESHLRLGRFLSHHGNWCPALLLRVQAGWGPCFHRPVASPHPGCLPFASSPPPASPCLLTTSVLPCTLTTSCFHCTLTTPCLPLRPPPSPGLPLVYQRTHLHLHFPAACRVFQVLMSSLPCISSVPYPLFLEQI